MRQSNPQLFGDYMQIVILDLTNTLQFALIIVESGLAVTLIPTMGIETKAVFADLIFKKFAFICVCKSHTSTHFHYFIIEQTDWSI